MIPFSVVLAARQSRGCAENFPRRAWAGDFRDSPGRIRMSQPLSHTSPPSTFGIVEVCPAVPQTLDLVAVTEAGLHPFHQLVIMSPTAAVARDDLDAESSAFAVFALPASYQETLSRHARRIRRRGDL